MDDKIYQLVTFRLGDEEFAVDILKVQEINRMVEITRVPKSSAFVEGVINLRGKIIPIIDLRKRFNLPKIDYNKLCRIIVVNIENTIVGLIVDSVSEVLRLKGDTIVPPPSLVTGIGAEYVKGVCKLEDRLLILLDLNKVLSSGDKKILEEVGSQGMSLSEG